MGAAGDSPAFFCALAAFSTFFARRSACFSSCVRFLLASCCARISAIHTTHAPKPSFVGARIVSLAGSATGSDSFAASFACTFAAFSAFFARRNACFSSCVRFLFASCWARISSAHTAHSRAPSFVISCVAAGSGSRVSIHHHDCLRQPATVSCWSFSAFLACTNAAFAAFFALRRACFSSCDRLLFASCCARIARSDAAAAFLTLLLRRLGINAFFRRNLHSDASDLWEVFLRKKGSVEELCEWMLVVAVVVFECGVALW